MTAKFLSECIEHLVVEGLLSEKLFGKRFDIRAFKAIKGDWRDLTRYAENAGLLYLDAGSSRAAFMLSAGKVLKILNRAPSSTSQNEREILAFQRFGREYVPQVFDYDPEFRWIIVEPARTFGFSPYDSKAMQAETDITGERLSSIASGIRDKQRGSPGAPENLEPQTVYNWAMAYRMKWYGDGLVKKNPDFDYYGALSPMGRELVDKFVYLTLRDVTDIARPDHWGVAADRRIVCVDSGIS